MTTGGVAPAERRGFLLFLIVLCALAGAYLGKALVGEVFVSTETVYRSVQPWSGLEAAPPPVHNENLADPPTVWLPMQSATRAMVRDWLFHGGEPPLWCPQSFCGAPWLGNMSSALFSPFTWLFVLLPFAPAFAVCAGAKWLLAGIGAWMLARKLGIGPAGRALAGIAYAFCGFQVVWIDSCLTNVSVWAPWLLLTIERVLERPSAGRTAALGLASWQVLVGGHPETSLYVGMAAAVFAVCRWLAAAEGKGARLGALLGGAALGGLLSVVQWWPFLEYALHSLGREQRLLQPDLFRLADSSDRGAAAVALCMVLLLALTWIRRGESWTRARRWVVGSALAALCVIAGWIARRGGLRPTLLLQVVPDWFGRSLDGGSYGGPLTYNDAVAGFCGGALFVLAVAVALVRAGDRRVLALALAGLVASARCFRIPLIEGVVDTLPQVSTTGATRALAALALVLALLAGFALDELGVRPRRLAAVAGAIVLFLVALAGTDEDFSPLRPVGESSAPEAGGAGFVALPNLAEAGPSGLGAEIGGFAPAGSGQVRLVINGVEKARLPTGPAREDGLRPFRWRFGGSHRLESGAYLVEAEAIDASGAARRFATQMARCERPPQPGPRWSLHLGALAVVLLAALVVPSARARGATLLLATVAELVLFGARYNDTTPVERLPRAVDPIPFLEQKRRELGPFRVFAARTHLHPNLHLLHDVDVVRGYDALEPVDYIHVLNMLYRDYIEVFWMEMDFGTLDFAGYPGAQLADVMNVRYVLSEESPPAGWREAWRQAGPRSSLALFENPDALPRLFTVQHGTNAAIAFERQQDLREIAAWEGPDELRLPGAGRVVASACTRGRIRATVDSDAGTILVVSENFGGWRATIDDAAAEIRRTHGTFLSVVVPAGGRHEVELAYRPASATRGGAISAGGCIILLALGLFTRRRARDPEPAAPRTGA